MYDHIQGILKSKAPLRAVVSTGGIGYKLFIPLNCYTRLPACESPVSFFLSFIVREDVQQLYGFLSEAERDLFEQLLNISGIGPKSAIAIIGHTDITAFQQAIATSNIRLLSSIPGIGKKTAERLIIEMRDRLPKLSSGGGSFLIDASQALMNLGYTPVAAQQAIQKTLKAHPEERDLGRLITLSLQSAK